MTYHDQAGRRGRRQFTRKVDADAFRRQVDRQIHDATYRKEGEHLTIRDLADMFLEHCAARMASGRRMSRHNLITYQGRLRRHVCNPEIGVGDVKLTQLTAGAVEDFADRLIASGVSIPTTRKVVSTLGNALNFAIRRDLVAINVADRAVIIAGDGDQDSKVIEPPSRVELARLLDACDDALAVKIRFAAATGLRASEQWAVRWRHIDLKAGAVRVETRVDQYRQERHTKTRAGRRVVPLSKAILTMLKEWKIRSPWAAPGDLVFPNREGRYTSHANFLHRDFRPAIERAGVEPFGWHALRHFAISTWIEAEVPLKAVQTYAGHSSMQVTVDRYGHLLKGADYQTALDLIGETLFNS